MIAGEEIALLASGSGVNFYSGVPCSYLSPLMNAIMVSDLPYQPAASEGEALGIAAGAWLAGRLPSVLAQNSGLGNMVNPLTSLCRTFNIPVLLFVTWRGFPGKADEPQHEQMGRIMHNLLDVLEISHEPLAESSSGLTDQLERVTGLLTSARRPFALIVPPDLVSGPDSVPPLQFEEQLPVYPSASMVPPGLLTRESVLQALLAHIPAQVAIIATTGKTGRELFTLHDRPGNFYMAGSMGCAPGIGLGVSMNVTIPTVVLDGDGALLMKMGTLATIGAATPRNLVHVLLDNGVHDSTGGQPTVSPAINWGQIAAACGYRKVLQCSTEKDIQNALDNALDANDGPVFIHILIRPGSMANLGRPTIAPPAVAERFRSFLEPHRSGLASS